VLGFLLIDKPKGISSHDAVNAVRRELAVRRVGHSGTLDPMATGLLVMAVGPATRFLQYLPLEPKVYEAEITFGFESTTLDSEGELVHPRAVPDDLEKRLRDLAPTLEGLHQQKPPMHSAAKVSGKALYRYAREGEEVERDARTVRIGSLEILEVKPPKAKVRIVCSGGTYVRVLAADIGNALGCGAYLSALRRTRVGRFELSDAVRLDDAKPSAIISMHDALPPMPIVELSTVDATALRQGKLISFPSSDLAPLQELVAVREREGSVFGVALVTANGLQPECILPSEAEIHNDESERKSARG
jgi:tRNA pseudouridine55 synthase